MKLILIIFITVEMCFHIDLLSQGGSNLMVLLQLLHVSVSELLTNLLELVSTEMLFCTGASVETS